MDTCSMSEVRELSNLEVEFISGGAPAPTESTAGKVGNQILYQWSCPTGYGLVGVMNGQQQAVTPGNDYQSFQCTANGSVQSAFAVQGAGWQVDSIVTWYGSG